MIDFLVSLLEANINFQSLGAITILYFASIWFLFCLWVFIDARKRFDRTLLALFFFFVVLIFNFPGLIFYLIIRPDKNEDHFLYIQNNEAVLESDRKGIDVPIINFIGENGEVNLSFQLKINRLTGVSSIQSNVENMASEVLQVNIGSQNPLPQSPNLPTVNTIDSNKHSLAPLPEKSPTAPVQKDGLPTLSMWEKVLVSIGNIRSSLAKKRVEVTKIDVSMDSQSLQPSSSEISTPSSQNQDQQFQKNKKDKNKKKKRRR